ncbi:MAG: hypothetical protein CMM47_11740 [Rhodospirillaceae bacterium]|nr:hypothetical protein [Rhodospirillaceae bacterium]
MIDDALDSVAIVASESAFAIGDTARGWSLCERRAGLPDGPPPAWDRGAPPSGPVLVCSEQGVGDEFIFLSCLPDLLHTVPDVIVECDTRNVALSQRSFPASQFVARTTTETGWGCCAWNYHYLVAERGPSAHLLSGSLPGLLGVGLARPAL